MPFVVTWCNLACQAEAEKLASLLSLPCEEQLSHAPLRPYSLQVTESRLQLVYSSGGVSSTLFAEFLKGPLGYRIAKGGGRNQLIARAVGLKMHKGKLRILDATAGLGRDAFILASLGCEVHMVERSQVMAALLFDGLKRAKLSDKACSTVSAIQVTVGDALGVLKNLKVENAPQVVYLDPMFPGEMKNALTKIEMRIIRDIVGGDLDADQLISLALQKAQKRVVVKRPRGAPTLANTLPSFEVAGKSSRYDVYLTGGANLIYD